MRPYVHAFNPTAAQYTAVSHNVHSMDWPILHEFPSPPYDSYCPCYDENMQPAPEQHATAQAQPFPASQSFREGPNIPLSVMQPPPVSADTVIKRDSPREIRNKAEKLRRDKINQSIAYLAKITPPVVALGRKVDKTNVLKLSAHYLRSHQYVFGDSINDEHQFTENSTRALMSLLKGFILTVTYKGIIVVVSQNVQQYLRYTELDLIGENVFKIIHEDDHQLLREQLMPRSLLLGTNGELLIPDEPGAEKKIAEALAGEKRRFIVRFKRLSQRSEPTQYVTCHVEGTMKKSDGACRENRQMIRRVRARGENPRSSGNDVVFIGLVRPTCETFAKDKNLESFWTEYRTRHTIDGEIIECDSRIALVTGYMTHEVNGVNAMNFMHRDDVRWVIIALREMYNQRRLVGESCYRLMTKNGKFIYMQTKGYLDVNEDSRAVTSFVCTNTMIDEKVGKQLIKEFKLLVNNNQKSLSNAEEESCEVTDNHILPVEDPKQLEKEILHMVTNLPSPQPQSPQSNSPADGDPSSSHLAIIPPKKERIVNAIEKIYSVIKTLNKKPEPKMETSFYKESQNYEEHIGQLPIETVTSDARLTIDPTSSILDGTVLSQVLIPGPDTYLNDQLLLATSNMDITPYPSTSILQSGDNLQTESQLNIESSASLDSYQAINSFTLPLSSPSTSLNDPEETFDMNDLDNRRIIRCKPLPDSLLSMVPSTSYNSIETDTFSSLYLNYYPNNEKILLDTIPVDISPPNCADYPLMKNSGKTVKDTYKSSPNGTDHKQQFKETSINHPMAIYSKSSYIPCAQNIVDTTEKKTEKISDAALVIDGSSSTEKSMVGGTKRPNEFDDHNDAATKRVAQDNFNDQSHKDEEISASDAFAMLDDSAIDYQCLPQNDSLDLILDQYIDFSFCDFHVLEKYVNGDETE